MKQKTGTEASITNNKKRKNENRLIIVTCVACLLALLGIGFGVYEFMDNSKKEEKIAKLQDLVNQLQDGTIVTINEKTKIKIISSSWSGWSADYKPEEVESYCGLELHEKCVVKTRQHSNTQGDKWTEDVLSFEVTTINDDGVGIHTFQTFSDKEEGVDLNSDKKDFVIKANESLVLTTPTMDEGDIFTLSLVQE